MVFGIQLLSSGLLQTSLACPTFFHFHSPSSTGSYTSYSNNIGYYLLTGQSSNTGKLLALEELQAGTTAGRDVANLVLNTVLLGNGCGVTTTDDDDLAVLLDGVDNGVEGGLCAAGELLELKDTGGTVPKDGLGLGNGLLVELDGLLTAVKSLPAVGDTVLVGSVASVGVLVELVGGDVVDGEDELDVLLLGLLNEVTDGLGAGLIEEGVSDGDVLEGLLEGEGHATADDEGVDLVKEVVDKLDLVGDLGTTEDGQEGALRVLEGLGEVLKLLLDEEAGGLLGEVDTDHGGVGTVGSAESVVDVDVTKSGQALAESLNLSLVGLGLVAVLVLGRAFLLNVESEVLEEDDRAILSLVDDLLDLRTDTIGGEGDLLAEELLKLSDNGLKGVLLVGGAVGSSEVRHEDDGLGTIFEGVLDGGEGTDNSLVVGDVLVGVERDVEVDLGGVLLVLKMAGYCIVEGLMGMRFRTGDCSNCSFNRVLIIQLDVCSMLTLCLSS
jgi:hypothetical protein